MFINAIERVQKFTRPIHTLLRNYNSSIIEPGCATLFIINADGWALTFKHVADLFKLSTILTKNRKNYYNDISLCKGKPKEKRLIKDTIRRYGYSKSSPFEVHIRVINCVVNASKIHSEKHPTLDIALLKFEDYEQLLCNEFPVFPKDTSGLKPGKFLCRFGFPFPEFTNFKLDTNRDEICWTSEGRDSSPWFPIEGMITRHLADKQSKICGFELSTPGLRGQSGGPAFDEEGNVMVCL